MKRVVPFFFLFLFLLISITHPQTNASPSWMKTGAYAQYQFNSTGVAFYNTTFIEFKNNATCTFRWKCTKIQNQMATLNISISFSGKKGFTLSETVYVNTSSREVFSTNGTFIGVTFLWGPTTITDDQKIILWNKPPDKIEGTATIIGKGVTPQGIQEAYAITANGTVSNKAIQIMRLYDLNTGFFIDGHLANDVLLTSTGINYFGLNGRLIFNETNVNLGPGEQQPTTHNQLTNNTDEQQPHIDATIIITTIFAAFFILFITSYHKQNTKKRRK